MDDCAECSCRGELMAGPLRFVEEVAFELTLKDE